MARVSKDFDQVVKLSNSVAQLMRENPYREGLVWATYEELQDNFSLSYPIPEDQHGTSTASSSIAVNTSRGDDASFLAVTSSGAEEQLARRRELREDIRGRYARVKDVTVDGQPVFCRFNTFRKNKLLRKRTRPVPSGISGGESEFPPPGLVRGRNPEQVMNFRALSREASAVNLLGEEANLSGVPVEETGQVVDVRTSATALRTGACECDGCELHCRFGASAMGSNPSAANAGGGAANVSTSAENTNTRDHVREVSAIVPGGTSTDACPPLPESTVVEVTQTSSSSPLQETGGYSGGSSPAQRVSEARNLPELRHSRNSSFATIHSQMEASSPQSPTAGQDPAQSPIFRTRSLPLRRQGSFVQQYGEQGSSSSVRLVAGYKAGPLHGRPRSSQHPAMTAGDHSSALRASGLDPASTPASPKSSAAVPRRGFPPAPPSGNASPVARGTATAETAPLVALRQASHESSSGVRQDSRQNSDVFAPTAAGRGQHQSEEGVVPEDDRLPHLLHSLGLPDRQETLIEEWAPEEPEISACWVYSNDRETWQLRDYAPETLRDRIVEWEIVAEKPQEEQEEETAGEEGAVPSTPIEGSSGGAVGHDEVNVVRGTSAARAAAGGDDSPRSSSEAGSTSKLAASTSKLAASSQVETYSLLRVAVVADEQGNNVDNIIGTSDSTGASADNNARAIPRINNEFLGTSSAAVSMTEVDDSAAVSSLALVFGDQSQHRSVLLELRASDAGASTSQPPKLVIAEQDARLSNIKGRFITPEESRIPVEDAQKIFIMRGLYSPGNEGPPDCSLICDEHFCRPEWTANWKYNLMGKAFYKEPIALNGVIAPYEGGLFKGWSWRILIPLGAQCMQMWMAGIITKQLSSVYRTLGQAVGCLCNVYLGDYWLLQNPDPAMRAKWQEVVTVTFVAIILCVSLFNFMTAPGPAEKQPQTSTTGVELETRDGSTGGGKKDARERSTSRRESSPSDGKEDSPDKQFDFELLVESSAESETDQLELRAPPK
ncbi:unnamed protein product [Amoebophrya sp. A25]|nr:unnamed protein product [Amoebophrya sp. A25]|eukprot:GSA25T00015825001.1